MGMRRELFHLEPRLKKKYPEWTEPESDFEEGEDIQKFEDEYYAEKKKELTEGWERAKKTLEETGGTAEEIATRKEKVDKKLEELEADYKIWVQHRKKPGYSFRGKDADETRSCTADQLVKMIEKQTELITKTKLKQSDKESLKTISLTTRFVFLSLLRVYAYRTPVPFSKINYLDPRFVPFLIRLNLSTYYSPSGLPPRTVQGTICLFRSSSPRPCVRSVGVGMFKMGTRLIRFIVPWAMDAPADWRF